MDFDGGPPPFAIDDVKDLSHHEHHLNNYIEDDVTTSKLPLPDVRSRSVTPETTGDRAVSDDVNDKGDNIASKVSLHDNKMDGFQNFDEAENQKIEVEEEEDDEWGDFAAPVQKSSPPGKMEIEEDDDWGDFDQARPSTDRAESSESSGPDSARSEVARQLAHQQSIEEWGGFENSSCATEKKDSDDEWQAEFSSAAPVTNFVPAEDLKMKMLEEMLDDDEFWDDGFLDEYEEFTEEKMGATDIPVLFDSESLADDIEQFDNEKERYTRLWLSLRVVEEAISLKFDWKDSDIRKTHFQAIKITPNDVKKESRPPAQLFDTHSLLLPTPLQPSSSTSTDDHRPKNQKTSSSSSVESPSVPAVDFDWDIAGLTNPMNRANRSSAIIDVDFLNTNGKATSYTSPLQKDLEQFGLTSQNGTVSAGSTILESIMSKAQVMTSSSSIPGQRTSYQSPEVLSLDARQLLNKLPDLQYLQSEVLMFPIGTNLPH